MLLQDKLRDFLTAKGINLHPTSRFWIYTDEEMRKSRVLRCQGFIDAYRSLDKLSYEEARNTIDCLSVLYYRPDETVEEMMAENPDMLRYLK